MTKKFQLLSTWMLAILFTIFFVAILFYSYSYLSYKPRYIPAQSSSWIGNDVSLRSRIKLYEACKMHFDTDPNTLTVTEQIKRTNYLKACTIPDYYPHHSVFQRLILDIFLIFFIGFLIRWFIINKWISRY